MENFDIIILTSIVSTLFIVFGIVVFKEFRNMEKKEWRDKNMGFERGPRAGFINFVANILSEENSKDYGKDELKSVYTTMQRTISDMETDGMYFPPEIKDKLKEKIQDLNCEYSGLPSVVSYSQNEK